MIYIFGNYTLDTWCYELQRCGQVLPLRPKAFHLLTYLLEHRDRVVSKQELFDHLWPQQHVSEATLDACITEVRRAIGDSGQTQHTIRTQRGLGYRFIAAVETRHQLSTTESNASPVASLPTLEPLAIPTSPESLANAEGTDRPGRVAPWPSPVRVPRLPGGERKTITVLACALTQTADLAGHLSLDAWYRVVQRYVALSRQVVQRYEGVIQHVGSGDFLAFFGAPVAHEDHAYRAVLAAFGMQQSLIKAEIVVSIGLHSGQVIVGPVSDDPTQAPLSVGLVTQVAESLRNLAPPGTVLLSDTTRQLIQDAAHLESVPWSPGGVTPLPVRVYQARENPAIIPKRQWQQRTLSPFVGRQGEMRALLELYTEVEQGHGQVVGIMGEPGMGKTRLLHEFHTHLRQRKRRYVVGHCHAYGQATPYLPLCELFRNTLSLTAAEPAEQVRDRVYSRLRHMDLTPEPWAPYLLYLLGVSDPQEDMSLLPPQTLRTRTFEALLQMYLRWSHEQPLVLTIENLHWIDPTSAAWLNALVERLAGMPIMLLVSYRPGYPPPWIDKSYATQVALRRLPAQDSLRVVQAVLPIGSASDDLVQCILTKADGNPFFLEELARTVVEQHDPHPTLNIPDTVQSVLAARIDRLSAESKHLLQVAAVIGKTVSVALLRAVAELPDSTYDLSLSHLQAAEFLYESRLLPEPEYAFKHALTQEVAYESLLQERRCALHARVVAALEEPTSDQRTTQVERLAYHAFHGEAWEKAVTYCQQAGVNAMVRSAYHEARVSFEQALLSLQHLAPSRESHELEVDLRCELLSALRPFGKADDMLKNLYEAEQLATTLGDVKRLGRVSNFLCVHFYLAGTYSQAIFHGERTLTLATTERDVELRLLATHYLGFIHWAQGDYGQAIAWLQDSLRLLNGEQIQERFGQVAQPSTGTRSYLARCYAEVGNFESGVAMGEEALTIAETSGLPISIVYACVGLSLPLLRLGELLRAQGLLERAMELCREMDTPLYALMPAAPLGVVYTRLGQVADALTLLEHVVKQSASLSGLGAAHQTHCLIALGEASMQAQAWGKAHDYASQALGHAQLHQERGHEAHALKLVGDIVSHPSQLNPERGERWYQQALSLAGTLGMRPLQAHCHASLGSLFDRTGHRQQARTHHQAAVDLYRALGMVRWQSRKSSGSSSGDRAED